MKKLSRNALHRSWLRWQCGNLSSMSFQWLASFGFADAMIPVIRELYGGDKEKEIAALKRHCAFYNTEPQLGSVINGIACSLEEERANGAELDDEVINGIKLGLMGPLAGIGDAMIPGMLVPLLLSIAIGLADGGNPLGPIFYIVAYISLTLVMSYALFMKGYQMGTNSVHFIVGETARRIRESFHLLGALVVGGVGASYVTISTALRIETNAAGAVIVVNDVLNGIFPKILPLAVILLCWWLMAKRKMSALRVMGLLVAASLLGVLLGVF